MGEIHKLLDAICDDFPRLKVASETLMKQYGVDENLTLAVETPEEVEKLPTFDPQVTRDLSPMLKERFRYAGDFKWGRDVWLSPSRMAAWMRKPDVQRYHRSLRENWIDSAPMLFADGQLTLYGITEDVPDNLTYLAWNANDEEPRVYVYAGLNTHEFQDLAGYLNWCLVRD